MDTTTLFLIIVTLVAIVLIAVGIYLVLVLHEARITLRRCNNILDHVDSIIEILDTKIARPASSVFGVLSMVREVTETLRGFMKERRGQKDGES